MQNFLKGKRILIIEDNVINIAVVSTILQNHGAEVVQDFWQSSPVDLITRHLPVDIILMDLMLSNGKSGYSVFDEIQKSQQLKNIPVVIVSASEPSLEIPKARRLGLAGYIAKPIQMIEFPKQVLQVIEGQKVWFAGE